MRNLSLRAKIIGLCIIVTVVPALILLTIILFQRQNLSNNVLLELKKTGRNYTSSIAEDMYNLCRNEYQLCNAGSCNEFIRSDLVSEANSLIRNTILSKKVGNSGYVFVLKGTGSDKGQYIISKDGKRDGENIWNATDANGKQFIQEIIEKSVNSKDGDVVFVNYPWKNGDDFNVRNKTAACIYFRPWDWVIGVGVYDDEFEKCVDRTNAALDAVIKSMIVVGILSVMIFVFVAVKMSNGILKPVNGICIVAQNIAKGDIDQKVEYNSKDEIGALADSFRELLKYIKDIAFMADSVSNGDLSVNIKPKSEKDVLSLNFIRAIKAVEMMKSDVNLLIGAAINGKLGTRADASKHNGEFRKIVQGVNETLDAVIGPLNMTAEYMNRISNGDIPQKITNEYNGDFNEIKNSLNRCIESINLLISDADKLAKAAIELRFDVRADASCHEGDFRKIVEGVNDTLDAVIEPLKLLINDASELSTAATNGELKTRADTERHRGDFRKVIMGVNNMLDKVNSPINEAIGILQKVAQRDLSARITSDYKGDFEKIKESMNKAINNLDEGLQKVAAASEQVALASGEIGKGSISLAQGASEQASSLEQISSSLQEMTAMTKQNSLNAMSAKGVADETRSTTLKGVESMNRLSEAIDSIKISSDQTAKIVKTIDEIAFQTNLLALNAAVEAARAGEAGRGFAVVAEEVRNLAMRSAEAAKNTANMIEESSKNALNGVFLNQEVLKNLGDISEQVNKVSEMMAEISAASDQQSDGIDQISRSLDQLNHLTQQNATNSEESASAGEELNCQAHEMMLLVNQFKLSKEIISEMTSPAERKMNKIIMYNNSIFKPDKKAAFAMASGKLTKDSPGGNGDNLISGKYRAEDAKRFLPLDATDLENLESF